MHLMSLVGRREEMSKVERRQLREDYYQFKDKDDPMSVFSFLFVRHPFSRFVSAYEEKMEVAAGKRENHRMDKVREEVIAKFPEHYT